MHKFVCVCASESQRDFVCILQPLFFRLLFSYKRIRTFLDELVLVCISCYVFLIAGSLYLSLPLPVTLYLCDEKEMMSSSFHSFIHSFILDGRIYCIYLFIINFFFIVVVGIVIVLLFVLPFILPFFPHFAHLLKQIFEFMDDRNRFVAFVNCLVALRVSVWCWLTVTAVAVLAWMIG